MLQWYALNLKPNAEYQVAEALEAKEIEIYLPTTKTSRPRRGRTSAPFFPSYLFARIDFEQTAYSIISWTPGIRRVVTIERRPAIIEDAIIAELRVRVDAFWAQGGVPAHPFKPGDRVRIQSGAMQGLMGIFEGPTTPSERVRILLNFLGGARPAEVPIQDLAAAADDEVDPQEVIVRERERAEAQRRRRGTRGKGRRIRYPDPKEQIT